MSLNAYVVFLLKRFNGLDGKMKEVTLYNDLSSPWFGLLPFLWKCALKDNKK